MLHQHNLMLTQFIFSKHIINIINLELGTARLQDRELELS